MQHVEPTIGYKLSRPTDWLPGHSIKYVRASLKRKARHAYLQDNENESWKVKPLNHQIVLTIDSYIFSLLPAEPSSYSSTLLNLPMNRRCRKKSNPQISLWIFKWKKIFLRTLFSTPCTNIFYLHSNRRGHSAPIVSPNRRTWNSSKITKPSRSFFLSQSRPSLNS